MRRGAGIVAAFALTMFAGAARAEEPAFHPECDAGDAAWVRRVVPALLGRQPFGTREIQVLTDLVKQLGRNRVAASLMHDPAFEARWADFLLDEARVERSGRRNQEDCFGAMARHEVTPELATFLRDHDPMEKAPGGVFTMADVLHSALRLDDVSPFFRAQLFAVMMRPLHRCVNLTPLENDENSRRAFGNLFSQVYLHRNITCMECHTDLHSPTKSTDPERNRFSPVPGNFNEALWGAERGRPVDESLLPFRGLGVVTFNLDYPMLKRSPNEVHPWGIVAPCGSLLPPSLIEDDPKDMKGFLGHNLGRKASIWDIEHDLRLGFFELRGGVPPFGDDGLRLEGPVAMASLLSQGIVQDVWMELFGMPLAVAHGFPRNSAQRDVLMDLTRAFVGSQWSIRVLLLRVVTHPLFNQGSPAGKCPATPYALARVVNPWSRDEENPARKDNSVGDLITRATGRSLLRSVSAALEWPEAPAFPSSDDATFQANIGAWVDRERPAVSDPTFQGLLSWEDQLGRCEAPQRHVKHDPLNLEIPRTQCAGRCDQSADDTVTGSHCSCDSSCELMGDCCADFQQACVIPEPPRPADWIDRVMAKAKTDKATLRDLISSLRDRLWSDPQPDAKEEPLLRTFFQTASLDTPFDDVPRGAERLRLYCGVLLKAPQFQLRGLPSVGSGPPPRLVLPGEAYEDRCRAWAPAVEATTGETLRCGPEVLTTAPAQREGRRPPKR
jgi:hypothetical protein